MHDAWADGSVVDRLHITKFSIAQQTSPWFAWIACGDSSQASSSREPEPSKAVFISLLDWAVVVDCESLHVSRDQLETLSQELKEAVYKKCVKSRGLLLVSQLVSQDPQRRKDLHPFECKSLIHMVRLAGIEPTTPWFVAKYSIQLSYSRDAFKYNLLIGIEMIGRA